VLVWCRLGSQTLERTNFGFEQDNSGDVALVFGSETEGLSSISPTAADTLPAVYLPMFSDHIRSYNLANTVSDYLARSASQTVSCFFQVSIGLWEAHRQQQIALEGNPS
jgi:tRNA(Leu) C34 or U34 (ribose-2'-O)-methylase TrmL